MASHIIGNWAGRYGGHDDTPGSAARLLTALTRLADTLRSRAWTSALLDGLNATSLALMAGVTLRLGGSALVDPLTVAITVVTLVLLWRTRLNSAWYIVAGAAVGLAHLAWA